MKIFSRDILEFVIQSNSSLRIILDEKFSKVFALHLGDIVTKYYVVTVRKRNFISPHPTTKVNGSQNWNKFPFDRLNMAPEGSRTHLPTRAIVVFFRVERHRAASPRCCVGKTFKSVKCTREWALESTLDDVAIVLSVDVVVESLKLHTPHTGRLKQRISSNVL